MRLVERLDKDCPQGEDGHTPDTCGELSVVDARCRQLLESLTREEITKWSAGLELCESDPEWSSYFQAEWKYMATDGTVQNIAQLCGLTEVLPFMPLSNVFYTDFPSADSGGSGGCGPPSLGVDKSLNFNEYGLAISGVYDCESFYSRYILGVNEDGNVRCEVVNGKHVASAGACLLCNDGRYKLLGHGCSNVPVAVAPVVTAAPSAAPTGFPTQSPSSEPSSEPTSEPSSEPSSQPTSQPSS
jgi:hypothetical protein